MQHVCMCTFYFHKWEDTDPPLCAIIYEQTIKSCRHGSRGNMYMYMILVTIFFNRVKTDDDDDVVVLCTSTLN